jgi:hypothetical protein
MQSNTPACEVSVNGVVYEPTRVLELEVERSKKSLLLLKELLGTPKMAELMVPYFDEMDKRWKEWVEASLKPDANGDL